MGRRAPTVEKIAAADVIERLRAQHAAPEWAFVENVCDSTSNNRRCDAMAVGQWHSVGHHLHGFEVKVARSDWLREIQDVAKAETFARYCDFWWIVAPEGIVRLEEMPERWGLKEVSGSSLKVRRPASKRDPEPLSRGLLVMLTRRAAEQCPADAVMAKAVGEAYERGKIDGAASVERGDDAQRELDRLRKRVEAFQAASGVDIDHYRGAQIAEAVKVVMEGAEAQKQGRENAGYAASYLERAAKDLREWLSRVESGGGGKGE